MANLNKVQLMGNMTRDVELRYTTSGTAVGNFGLAINKKWKSKDGEHKEETTFVDCDVWGKSAETLKQYTQKGSNIFIEGELKLHTWQDQNSGQQRSKLSVNVLNFQFLSRAENPHSPQTAPQQQQNSFYQQPQPQQRQNSGYQQAPQQQNVIPASDMPPQFSPVVEPTDDIPF